MPDDDDVADSYEWLVEQVEAAGYARYGSPILRCRVLKARTTLDTGPPAITWSLGVAAHSHLDGARHGAVRSWNVESVEDYMAAIEKDTAAGRV